MNEYYVAKLHDCKGCNGTGRVWRIPDPKNEGMSCPICHGAGKMPEWIPLIEALQDGYFFPGAGVAPWRYKTE